MIESDEYFIFPQLSLNEMYEKKLNEIDLNKIIGITHSGAYVYAIKTSNSLCELLVLYLVLST